MDRPTAILRRLLVLEALQESMTREQILLKEQMRNNGLKIIHRKNNVQDVWIQYIHQNQHEEAIFMKKMLDAEAKNRAKRTGMIT